MERREKQKEKLPMALPLTVNQLYTSVQRLIAFFLQCSLLDLARPRKDRHLVTLANAEPFIYKGLHCQGMGGGAAAANPQRSDLPSRKNLCSFQLRRTRLADRLQQQRLSQLQAPPRQPPKPMSERGGVASTYHFCPLADPSIGNFFTSHCVAQDFVWSALWSEKIPAFFLSLCLSLHKIGSAWPPESFPCSVLPPHSIFHSYDSPTNLSLLTPALYLCVFCVLSR